MKIIGWFVISALFFLAATRIMENRITYYPLKEHVSDLSSMGIDFMDFAFPSEDGLMLHGWYCRPPADVAHRADILFFPGNGGNISYRPPKLKPLLDMGLGVFIFDYRGYGRSEGKPKDHGILMDAGSAFRKFKEIREGSLRPLGFYGESLGSLLAVRQAADNEELAFIILEGSFPGRRAFLLRNPLFWPFLPFVSTALEMGDIPEKIKSPALVMHSRQDEIIPYPLGRKVFEKLGEGAVFYQIRHGGHNDAFMLENDFYPAICRFLESVLPEDK